jgi:hypothetical protein
MQTSLVELSFTFSRIYYINRTLILLIELVRDSRAVESESASAGILDGVGVGVSKNVPTATPTSI